MAERKAALGRVPDRLELRTLPDRARTVTLTDIRSSKATEGLHAPHATSCSAYGRALLFLDDGLYRSASGSREDHEVALTAADRASDAGHLDFAEMEAYLSRLLQAQLEDS